MNGHITEHMQVIEQKIGNPFADGADLSIIKWPRSAGLSGGTGDRGRALTWGEEHGSHTNRSGNQNITSTYRSGWIAVYARARSMRCTQPLGWAKGALRAMPTRQGGARFALPTYG
jgi:hypothetical protein